MIRAFLGRLVHHLASARLAAWLIVTLVAFSMLGFIIPQRAQLTPNQYAQFEADNQVLASAIDVLGFDSLFASIPMLAIIGLLALNVAVCTWRRVARHFRTPSVTAGFRATGERLLDDAEDGAAVIDRARRELQATGWRVRVDGEALLAIRGRGGFWGSVVLHVAMLVVVAGAIWTSLTGFGGTLVLTSGQTLPDVETSYTALTRLPRLGDPYTGANLTLESMEFGYEGDVLVSVIARMSGGTADGTIVRQPVRVNYPFVVDGKQYLLRDSGLAADVTVAYEDTSNRVVINLAEETAFGWQDVIRLPDGRTIRMRVAPVPLADGEEMPRESLPAIDPELRMQVVDEDGTASDTQIAYPGETAVADGVSVTFHDSPVWSTFLARGDDGRWTTYIGLWACVVGTMWRFFVPERRIAAAVRERSGTRKLALGYRVRPWVGFSAPGDEDLVRRLLGSGPDDKDRI